MRQLFSVAAAILCIPILLKCGLTIGPVLLILGVAAGFLGGLGPQAVLTAFTDVFTQASSLSSVLIVVEIGMLSVLMAQYGLLERMERAMRKLIPSARINIMLIPAMVGILQAPGGAAVSAPPVNRLGEEMGLTRAQRSNINVVCRHFLVVFASFSVNMIVVQSVAPQVDIVRLGLLNFPFVLLMQAAGYFIFLRKAKPLPQEKVSVRAWWGALGEFLIAMSPVFSIILINALFGTPYELALLVSFLLVFLLGREKKEFPLRLVKSFSPSLAVLIVGVYFFQHIVERMDDLLALFAALITGQSSLMFLTMVAVVGICFGLATGLMYLPLGVLIPIVVAAPHASEMALLVDLFYAFIWCFIGYLFSPLHLCQLLSDKETGCTVGERYKTYLPLMVVLPILVVALYFLYKLILL